MVNNPEKVIAIEDNTDVPMATKEELLAGADEQLKVVVNGKGFLIKKLSVGDLAAIRKFNKGKGDPDDPILSVMGMVFKGLLDPKLQYGEVEKLDMKILTDLSEEISKLSGWTTEAAETTQNL